MRKLLAKRARGDGPGSSPQKKNSTGEGSMTMIDVSYFQGTHFKCFHCFCIHHMMITPPFYRDFREDYVSSHKSGKKVFMRLCVKKRTGYRSHAEDLTFHIIHFIIQMAY